MRDIRLILFFGIFFVHAAIAVGQGEDRTKAEVIQTEPAQVVAFHVAGPVLVAPVNQEVDVSAKETLIFKWNPADTPFEVYGYLFRVYRNSDRSPKNAVYTEQVSGMDASVSVSTDHFEEGQAYTWCVKQVNNGPQLMFSDSVCASFKCINKQKTEESLPET